MLNISEKMRYLILCVVAITVTLLVFRFGFSYIFPLLLAYWLGKLLLPIVKILEKRLRLPSGVASGVVTIVFLCTLLILIFFLFKIIFSQLELFLSHFDELRSSLLFSLEHVCNGCDYYFHLPDGTASDVINTSLVRISDNFEDDMLPKITSLSLQFGSRLISGCITFFFLFFAVYYMLKEREKLIERYHENLLFQEIQMIKEKLTHTGAAWIKTQLIIMLIVAVITSLALILIHNPYAVLLGMIIALLDAFPFIGSGTVLVPWGIILLFRQNYYPAVILLVCFVLCQCAREFLEPRLLGNHMGISPFYSLISVYLGLKFYGLWGIFLGPLSFVIIQTVINNGQRFRT